MLSRPCCSVANAVVAVWCPSDSPAALAKTVAKARAPLLALACLKHLRWNQSTNCPMNHQRTLVRPQAEESVEMPMYGTSLPTLLHQKIVPSSEGLSNDRRPSCICGTERRGNCFDCATGGKWPSGSLPLTPGVSPSKKDTCAVSSDTELCQSRISAPGSAQCTGATGLPRTLAAAQNCGVSRCLKQKGRCKQRREWI